MFIYTERSRGIYIFQGREIKGTNKDTLFSGTIKERLKSE